MPAVPFLKNSLPVDELLVRELTIDDVAFVALAFLPDRTESELYGHTLDELPILRESGFLTPFVIVDGGGEGRILGGLTLTRYDPARARVELGYWLFPEARGRGIATRVVRAVADEAFANGIARLEAVARPENSASIRVLERAGFRREGTLRSLLPHGDGRADAQIYSLLPDDRP